MFSDLFQSVFILVCYSLSLSLSIYIYIYIYERKMKINSIVWKYKDMKKQDIQKMYLFIYE